MAHDFAVAFYKSSAWQKCRAAYIAYRISVDGGLCEQCGDALGYIVHHTILLTPDNITQADIALNTSLLKYVCKNCHDKYDGHAHGGESQRRYRFDEYGKIVYK